ncbi:hypothetical protein JEM70_02405 [Bacillaceae bacterium HSR45]|nr:hypothetical protein [Bacillaceae bacterium HSR45]
MKRFLFWLLVIGIVCFGAHNVQASQKKRSRLGKPPQKNRQKPLQESRLKVWNLTGSGSSGTTF